MDIHNTTIHVRADVPHFQGHVTSPGVAVVDRISVPADQRRRGIGGGLYRSWERGLPAGVTFIHLWACKAAVPFWRSMGFIEDGIMPTTTGPVGMGKTLGGSIG